MITFFLYLIWSQKVADGKFRVNQVINCYIDLSELLKRGKCYWQNKSYCRY